MTDRPTGPASRSFRLEVLAGTAVLLVIFAALGVVAYRLQRPSPPSRIAGPRPIAPVPAPGVPAGEASRQPVLRGSGEDGSTSDTAAPTAMAASAATAAGPAVLILGDSIAVDPPARWDPFTGWGHKLQGFEAVFPLRETGRPIPLRESPHALRFLAEWLAAHPRPAPLILWNLGLHDLRRMDAPTEPRAVPPDVYADNLRAMGRLLLDTGARVWWITTTPVREVPLGIFGHTHEPIRNLYALNADVLAYNAAAEAVMRDLGIPVIDLHAYSLEEIGPDELRDALHWSEDASRLQAGFIAERLRADLARDPLTPAPSASDSPTSPPLSIPTPSTISSIADPAASPIHNPQSANPNPPAPSA